MFTDFFFYLELLQERGRLYRIVLWLDSLATLMLVVFATVRFYFFSFFLFLVSVIFAVIFIGLLTYCLRTFKNYDSGGPFYKENYFPFVLLAIKLLFVSMLFLCSSWKLALSSLFLAFFLSPATYVFLLLISEFVFLPHVRFRRFFDRENYFREIASDPSEGASSFGRPEILILHADERRGRTGYEVYYPLVRSLSSYSFLFYLHEDSSIGFWRDFLSYRNFMFVLSSLLLFVLASLSLRAVMNELFVFQHKHLMEAISVVVFVFWMYFLVRFLLYFFPENLYGALINYVPNWEIIENFRFFYRMPGEVEWREFPVLERVPHFLSERRYVKEIVITLLVVPVVQFLLTSDVWNLKSSEEKKEGKKAGVSVYIEGKREGGDRVNDCKTGGKNVLPRGKKGRGELSWNDKGISDAVKVSPRTVDHFEE